MRSILRFLEGGTLKVMPKHAFGAQGRVKGLSWLLGNPDDFLDGKTPARRKLLQSNGGGKLPVSRPGLPSGTSGPGDNLGLIIQQRSLPK